MTHSPRPKVKKSTAKRQVRFSRSTGVRGPAAAAQSRAVG